MNIYLGNVLRIFKRKPVVVQYWIILPIWTYLLILYIIYYTCRKVVYIYTIYCVGFKNRASLYKTKISLFIIMCLCSPVYNQSILCTNTEIIVVYTYLFVGTEMKIVFLISLTDQMCIAFFIFSFGVFFIRNRITYYSTLSSGGSFGRLVGKCRRGPI